MKNDERERDFYAAALGPGPDCPPADRLAEMVSRGGDPTPAELRTHIANCPHCRTELHMLQMFLQPEAEELASASVQRIAKKVRQKRNLLQEGGKSWAAFFSFGRLGQAALAAAVILVAAAVTVQVRYGHRPDLGAVQENEVLRSAEVTIVTPSGDMDHAPETIDWNPVPHAARYEVQIKEVDGSEFWKSETPAARIRIPQEVRERMIPRKTLLIDIKALRGNGEPIAESAPVRFRVVASNAQRR